MRLSILSWVAITCSARLVLVHIARVGWPAKVPPIFHMGKWPKAEFAIVQLQGGNMTAAVVRALKATADKFGPTAGVMVCFNPPRPFGEKTPTAPY